MGELWSKAVDYLMQNARTLLDAPLVFVAVLALAFGLAYWFSNLRYQGALDQKDATIQSLRTQLDGVQRTVSDLQARMADLTRSRPHEASAVDPDGAYQFDEQVGTVHDAQVDESQGLASFSSITNAASFNLQKDFRYRKLLLHVKSVGAESLASISGVRTRAIFQVKCDIVGRVAGP
jgi:hypothetical protein